MAGKFEDFKLSASGVVANVAKGAIGVGLSSIGLAGLSSLFGVQDRLINVVANLGQSKKTTSTEQITSPQEQETEGKPVTSKKSMTKSIKDSGSKDNKEELRLAQEERVRIHNEFVKAIDILKETKFASKDIGKFVNEMSVAFKEGKSISQKEAGMLVDVMESQKVNSAGFKDLLNSQTRSGKSVKEAFMEKPGEFTAAGFRQTVMEKMLQSAGLGGVSQIFNLPTRLDSVFATWKTKLFSKEEKIKDAIKASEKVSSTKLDELKDATEDQTEEMYNQSNTLENIDSSIDGQSQAVINSAKKSSDKDKEGGGVFDWLLGKTGIKGLLSKGKGAVGSVIGGAKGLVSGAAGLLSTMGTTAAGFGTVGAGAATAGTAVAGLAAGYGIGTGINKGLGALFGLNKASDKWYEGGVGGWLGEQAYDIYDKSTDAIGKATSAYIKDTTDYFKNGFAGVKEFGSWLGDTATESWNTFTNTFDAVKNAVMNPVDTISGLFKSVMDGFNNMWTWLEGLPVVGKLFKSMSGGIGFVAGKVGAATTTGTTTAATTTTGVSPTIPNAANVRPAGGQTPAQSNVQIVNAGGGKGSGGKSMGIDDYGVALANSALFGS